MAPEIQRPAAPSSEPPVSESDVTKPEQTVEEAAVEHQLSEKTLDQGRDAMSCVLAQMYYRYIEDFFSGKNKQAAVLVVLLNTIS
jgi:hypothetical protein